MNTVGKIEKCTSDKVMDIVVKVILALLIILIMYPLIYVVSSSVSAGTAVTAGKVVLLPVDFSIKGYEIVFSYRSVWSGYMNTIIYTIVGTVMNLFLTILCAYPLSRKDLQGRGLYTIIFLIPMFFSGGMIPNYILMTNLHINNTRWAILLSGALSIYNMIIMRTFFQNSIPGELLEAAKIDGIDDFGYLFKIALPLSKPVIAVITLYYGVMHWNSYFTSMLYLRNRELYPLQLVLRDILNVSKIDASQIMDAELMAQLSGLADTMKYSLIVIATVPVLIFYPIVQRFFEKGIMIGSVKG